MTRKPGAYQRRRGHDFEREVATQLRLALPGAVVVRGQQGHGGADAPDVAVDSAGGSRWLGIECKRGPQGRVPLLPALAQAVRDCDGTGRVPLAVVREDRRKALAIMDALELRSLRDAAHVEGARVAWWETPLVRSRLRESLAAVTDAPAGLVAVGVLAGPPHVAFIAWSDLLGRVLAPLWAARMRGAT